MQKFNWRTDIYAGFLNLDHRTDRLERTLGELARVGITAERTRGTVPSEFDLSDPKLQVMVNRTPGAIGCHYGQVEIMTKALAANKCAFVMEDDLVFCDDFAERMDIVQEFLNTPENSDWDILWGGGTYHVNPTWHKLGAPEVGAANTWVSMSQAGIHSNPDLRMCKCTKNADWEPTDNPRIRRTYGAFSTHAYIVNIKSLPKILDLLEKNVYRSMGIDWIMILLQPELKAYAFNPGMIKQYNNASDIGDGQVTDFEGFAKLGAHWFAARM